MQLKQAKSLFYKILIACLVSTATLAVITILVGSFNDIAVRALWTIVLVAFHTLLGIGFIEAREKQASLAYLNLFTNVVFGLIVISFITSVLSTWQIITGDLVARFYYSYFVILFAVLHGESLAKMLGKDKNLNAVIVSNYVVMTFVVTLFIVAIFASGNITLDPFFYRLLAALGVVDATLTLVAIIMNNLYLQKHPELKFSALSVADPQQNERGHHTSTGHRIVNVFGIILIGYIVLQFAGSIIYAVMSFR